MSDLIPRGTAVFSPCQQYRYCLTREWYSQQPRVLWIMLNPSTADATEDDPTVRRCIDFTRRWNYGSLTVCNLFAWRATDPEWLLKVPNPVGPDNDAHICLQAQSANLIVAAWGSHNAVGTRAIDIYREIHGRNVFCLGTTQNGSPRHPLYIPADQPLQLWTPPLNPEGLNHAR
jgi:hypothetical protein